MSRKSKAEVDHEVALTPPQIAKRWVCNNDKVIKFIEAGELAAFDLRSPGATRPRWRVYLSDVAEFESARGLSRQTKSRRRPPVGDVVEFV